MKSFRWDLKKENNSGPRIGAWSCFLFPQIYPRVNFIMYPVIRFLTTSVNAVLSRPVEIDGACEISIRCMPWDIDMFFEMNNGRVLTLCDLGRFSLAIRTGLTKVLRKNHWGLVVAGGTTRYRRRIRMFNKITMRTQVVAFDDRWFYIEQSLWVKGQAASSVLLRTGVTSNGKVIASSEVLEALGATHMKLEPSDWVQSWISSEENRPWPPSS